MNEWLLQARRSARTKVVVTTTLLAVVLAGAAFLIGVGVLQSLLVATTVAVIGIVYLVLSDLDDEPVLPPLDESGRNTGTRREVSRLSWVMAGQDNRVGAAPYRRLRAIAANRLALLGIDLGEEEGRRAARELLGPVGYGTLVEDSLSTPTQRVFADCVTLLERLDLSRPVPHHGWVPDAPDPVSTPTLRSSARE